MTSDGCSREAKVLVLHADGGIAKDCKSGDDVFFTWQEHRDWENFPEVIDDLKGRMRSGHMIVYNRRVRNRQGLEVAPPEKSTVVERLKSLFGVRSSSPRRKTGGCATDLCIAAGYWYEKPKPW